MQSAITLPLLLVSLFLLCSCQYQRPLPPRAPAPILFADDGDRQALLLSARNHRTYLSRLPAGYRTTIAGVSYPASWLVRSMDEFIALIEKNPDPRELSRRIRERFTIIPAGTGSAPSAGEVLVTGYYEPLLAGSLTKKAPYLYPLYRLPKSLISRPDPVTGKKSVGRRGESGAFVPFWTRAEIENSRRLAGDELVYLKDPFDVSQLQVQGSGRIVLQDGSQRPVRFAGHNGHAFKSIGRLLVEEGKLSMKNVSIPAIRRYLAAHPAERRRILQHNPRFIFFKWGDDDLPPRGSLGVPLTAERSIAIDRNVLPDGLIAWLETARPLIDSKGAIRTWQPMRRFVLPQDSGAAITGPGRADFFWGSGNYAEIAASSMKEKGKLYFLVKKGYRGD